MKAICCFLLIVINMLMVSGLASPVQAGQTVRIGYEQNHPMAGTASDGKAQGIMIDLIQEIARREGWTIKYMPCIWNKCLENLENAEIDLLLGIAYTQERAQKYSYNQHTVISNWGLLYSRTGQKIESYTDLQGKRATTDEERTHPTIVNGPT